MDLIGVAGRGMLLMLGAMAGLIIGIVVLQIMLRPLNPKDSTRTTQLIESLFLLFICWLIVPFAWQMLFAVIGIPVWLLSIFLSPGFSITVVLVVASIFVLRHKGLPSVARVYNYALSDLVAMVFAIAFLPISASALCGFDLGMPDGRTFVLTVFALAVLYLRGLPRLNSNSVPVGSVRAAFLFVYPSMVLACLAFFVQMALLLTCVLFLPNITYNKQIYQLFIRLLIAAVVLIASYALVQRTKSAGESTGQASPVPRPGIDRMAAVCLISVVLPLAFYGLDFGFMFGPRVDLGGRGGAYGTVDDVKAPQFVQYPNFVWPERGSVLTTRLQRKDLLIDGKPVPAMVILDFDEILRTDDRLHVSVNLRRVHGGLQALVRSYRSARAVVFDLENGSVVKVPLLPIPLRWFRPSALLARNTNKMRTVPLCATEDCLLAQ